MDINPIISLLSTILQYDIFKLIDQNLNGSLSQLLSSLKMYFRAVDLTYHIS